jgi:acyl-coenzyme A synthetase/AMP-(fatty) acid ligase
MDPAPRRAYRAPVTEATHPSLFDEGPFAPCPAPFNMAVHTLAVADRTPDKVALEVLVAPGEVAESWTYADLRAAILGTAGGLASLGIGKGDRVLLRLGNSADFPIAFFAANAIGAVPVPSSAQLTPGEFEAIRADLDPALVVLGLPAELPPGTHRLDLHGLRALRSHPPAGFAETAPDDPAYMVYTSGTSGRPKGVVHGQRAAWARRMMWDGWYGLTAQDRVLHPGAFNWTYTLGVGLTDPWAAGATALVYAGPPDRHVWPRLAAAHRPTIFAAAPGVYRQMLDAPDLAKGFVSLRHGLSAGEAWPATLASAWTGATGKPVYEALGMSEVSTYLSFCPSHPPIPDASGRPQPGRRVAILPEAGTEPVPVGSEGLLAVSCRDPGLMLGYWRRPEETAAAFRGEWFLTGDRARMNPDGTVTHLGRADEVMNAGGYRVAPQEVEAALLKHPFIGDCAVTEIEARTGVTVIAAFYTSARPLDADELGAHCAARLARYKCPRIFHRLDRLPRSPTGKLLRRHLREVPE